MFDSAQLRSTNPVNSKTSRSLLHSDFSNVSPTTAGKLNITRDWVQDGADLVLQATISMTKGAKAVEPGSFGFPIEFNKIFTSRTADQVTAECSLVNPYIGLGAGYLQVARLGGNVPDMVVTPSNFGIKFEAWRFLAEFNGAPYYYQSTGFKGLYS
ncbi:hypothetical protein CLAFUW4_04107 [Fulvia fulva]|uniref:Uncharacterized protein n=1 Tax=Passalora fulva TaxID=5499 RepID=A0A9Q8LEL9_PASFU|nr:uncharacterized protein CLAFUR5_04069 [Fulvia fulva]KAK4627345.1 hypothetical protein CLAFUR4_04093 [Fulvia fulva]KAK4627807.1 hypothetical protein CLAFUR0_04094 [Fulvia fulva]UJO15993.1 hypothetical protein CLAFUR5_04069 [Fulvia fulva]WPV13129.1 hypothetical protein CLAFUW4_04107 [Fulvia fulva]WPV28764.1 hypothetical protein CLAFUW7_04096 [Fulvia fulva]